MTKRLRSPVDLPGVTETLKHWLDSLAEVIGELQHEVTELQSGGEVALAPGVIARVAPPSEGTTATLPAPSSDNVGQAATLILEQSLGEVSVVAVPHTAADGSSSTSTVNGSERLTLSDPGKYQFLSNGVDGWFS